MESVRVALRESSGSATKKMKVMTDGAGRNNGRRPATAKSIPRLTFRYPKTELEAAIQRYVGLFDFAPIGYVTFSRSGRIEEVNVTAAHLLGRSRRQLIGSAFAVCVARKDVQRFLNHLFQCRSSDRPVVTELSLKRPNGEEFPVQLSTTVTLALMKDGTQSYQSAIVDLSERKRFEETIRRSEERYRSLFDLVPVAVYVSDADGIIQEYNRRAVELWGRQPSGNGNQPRFCGSHKIYYPDGRPMPQEKNPMARALRGEKLKANDLEIVVERPDGDRRQVVSSPRILTNKRGKIVGAINCLFDVTDRKRAERAAMRLAAAVQSSHDAVVAKTLDGIVTDWNQSAQRIFGYRPKEIIGKSILSLIPKDRQDEEADILRKVRRGESLDHYETVRWRKDGRLIDVSLTISPIKGPNGEIVGVSKIARDITKQKQTERRLVEQARLLDLTSDAIIVRDHQDRIVYWNQGAEKMYGFSAKEALGKITYQLVQTRHPENFASIRKKLERDNHWWGELIHTRKDGTTIVVLSRWNLDRNASGRPDSILETNTDITHRKRAEQQQRALFQFARRQNMATSVGEIHDAALDAILSAMDCQRASILLFDQEKVMQFVAWRGLSARYRKAVKGHSPWKPDAKEPEPVCISNVEIANIPRSLKSTIRSEGIHSAAFIPLLSSQKLIGKFMIYYDAPHVFTDDELKLATTIAAQLAQGIEQKRDEEALRLSEARMRATVEQATAGMVRCDTDGRFIFVNHTFCQMLGYTESELVGKTIASVTHRDDLKEKMHSFRRMIREGKSFDMEKRYVRKDGSILWATVSASAVRGPDGKIQSGIGVVVDINDRKNAEAALQKSKELLELRVRDRTRQLHVANKELQSEIERRKGLEGEILAVSDREQQRLGQELHDGLCQHLTAVAFMARSIALRLKQHRVIDAQDIEKIAELVNTAATDTRNLSRALHRMDVDAAGFTIALEDLVDREIWKIPCRLEIKPGFRIEDDAAAAQLYRIAREAVINANKHAQAREIVLQLEPWGQGMVLRVIDDGIGVVNESKLRQGLGFHIMKYRARLIGGRLEIACSKCSKRRGTCVSCYLPNHVHQPQNANGKGKRWRFPSKITKALAALV